MTTAEIVYIVTRGALAMGLWVLIFLFLLRLRNR